MSDYQADISIASRPEADSGNSGQPFRFEPKHGVVLAATILAFGIFAAPQHALGTVALILIGAIIAWFMPQAMIAMVVLSVPAQDAILMPFVRGEITLTQITVFGLIAGWGIGFWRYRIWLDSILMWSLGIMAALILSFLATDDTGVWVGELYRWAVAIAFFVICRSVLRDWAAIRIVIWGIVAAVCAICAYALGQLSSQDENINWIVGGILRVHGTFGTPNPLAAYIELTVPILLALTLLGLSPVVRERLGGPLWLGMASASLLGMVVLGLTQSRGGWIGFAVGMGVIFLLLPFRIKVASAALGAVLIAGILITPAGQSQIERFGNIFDDSEPATGSSYDYGTGRSSLWGAAIRMFEDEPLTGVGAGEFDYHYREYTPVWYDRFPRGQAHNGWLQMAAQAGLPGVIAFTGWIVATLVSLVGAVRRSTDPLARALALGALSVMVAFTVHSLVDYLNVLSLGLQLSAILAIGLNLCPDPLTVHARTSESKTGSLRVPQQTSYA